MTSAPTIVKATNAPSTQNRYSALDGVRGFFMLIFMAAHFGVAAVEGAWIGLNAFFTMSAYLIVSLLLRERHKTGRISAIGFYFRRARRLLPALTVLLLFVSTYSWLFQNSVDKRQTGGDVLAAGGFVINWRLIGRSDDYFGDFENPSMLRHLWTLSVEEQFYIVIPFLLTMLFLLKSRRLAIIVLMLIMVASAWRTMAIGVGTLQAQIHAYYGTDTRVQAFAIGAALAFWVPLGAPLPRGLTPGRVRFIGLLGFASMVIGFFVLTPMSEFMFENGGLVLYNFFGAALILGVARPESKELYWILGGRFIVWLGERAYGLYIWHWPIGLILVWQFPEMSWWLRFILAFALSIAVTGASYRWIEKPVLNGGLRALHPRIKTGRTVFVVALSSVLIAGINLAKTPVPSNAAVYFDVPSLLPEEPQYIPSTSPIRVALLGDSIAAGLVQHLQTAKYPDIEVIDLAVPGCDFSLWTPAAFTEVRTELDPDCVALLEDLEQRVQDADVDVVLMMGLQSGALPHLTDEGEFLLSTDARYLTRLNDTLVDLKDKSARGGADVFATLTVPCRFGMEAPEVGLPDAAVRFIEQYPDEARRYADPAEFNNWIRDWSQTNSVPTLDLYEALGCESGFKPEINGVTLFKDYLHFTPEAGAMLWSWLAPRSRELLESLESAS